MKTTPISRSIAERLAEAKQQLIELRQEHGAAVLHASRSPEDKGLAQVVVDHEVAIDSFAKMISRLESAQQAEAREVVEVDLEAKRKLHSERRADVKRLSVEIEQLATKVVAVLEAVAPSLQRLDAAIGERQRIVYAALVAAHGSKKASHMNPDSLSARGTVETGLIGAIVSSGIGVAPSLAPAVLVTEPWQGIREGAYSSERMARNLAANQAQIDKLFKDAEAA